MCSLRPVLRPFVLAVALILTGSAIAEANPRPPIVIYPSRPVYTPGLRVSPGVYVYPQVSSAPSYYYPLYPTYPVYPTYPYAGPVYGGSYYYGTWGGTSLYPTYPYSGVYPNYGYGYSYYYRIR